MNTKKSIPTTLLLALMSAPALASPLESFVDEIGRNVLINQPADNTLGRFVGHQEWTG